MSFKNKVTSRINEVRKFNSKETLTVRAVSLLVSSLASIACLLILGREATLFFLVGLAVVSGWKIIELAVDDEIEKNGDPLNLRKPKARKRKNDERRRLQIIDEDDNDDDSGSANHEFNTMGRH